MLQFPSGVYALHQFRDRKKSGQGVILRDAHGSASGRHLQAGLRIHPVAERVQKARDRSVPGAGSRQDTVRSVAVLEEIPVSPADTGVYSILRLCQFRPALTCMFTESVADGYHMLL